MGARILCTRTSCKTRWHASIRSDNHQTLNFVAPHSTGQLPGSFLKIAQEATRQRMTSPARNGTSVSSPIFRLRGISHRSRMSVMVSVWRGRP